MKKYIFHVLLTAVMVFVCGLLPALGAYDALDSTHWSVALWGGIVGTVSTVGAYWCGATIQGNGAFETKEFIANLIGAVLGTFFACMTFIVP